MDYKEVKDMINSIREGNYHVAYEEPNNIESCTAPDGRTFYRVTDKDSWKTSTIFGECQVEVNGYHFTFDWGFENFKERVESDFFDQLEDFQLNDGTIVRKDEVIEQVMNEFDKRDDIYTDSYTNPYEQMWIYCQIRNMSLPEYYWWDDEDCPIDINKSWYHMTPPKELGFGTVKYEREKYYLVRIRARQT